MSELVHRFSFGTATWSREVGICALVLWLLILTCAVSSIRSQRFAAGQRWFWIVLVVCLPIVGLLLYLPFSIPRDDLPRASLYAPRKKAGRRQKSSS